MIRAVICFFFVAGLLIACSKNQEGKPGAQSIATPVAVPPPQLTVTNLPGAAPSASPSPDAPMIERGIEVKNAGNLFLTFPKTWRDRLGRVAEAGRMYDSIQFRPQSNDTFALMVNVNNVGQSNADKLDLNAILLKAGQGELTNAVEKSLDVHEFEGSQVKGCYFVITDKNRTIAAPKPGQYLYLTQGYAKIDRLILSFRLVSNHLSPEQEETLEMIKTARLEKK